MLLEHGTYSENITLWKQVKRWLLCCILSLTCISGRLYAQYYPAPAPVAANQLHTLSTRLKTTRNAHERIQTLNALCNLYHNLPYKNPADLTLAEQYAKQALAEGTRINDQAGMSEALLLLGQLYYFSDALDSFEQLPGKANDSTRAKLFLQLSFYIWGRDAKDKTQDYLRSNDYARKAAAITERLGLKDLTLMAARNIAINNLYLKKPDAEADVLKIIATYKRTGYKKLQYIYYPLTCYFDFVRQTDKSYYYSEAAVTAVDATRDTLSAGDIYIEKSVLAYRREKYEEAINACKQALKYYEHQPSIYYVSSPMVHEIISAAYNKMGKKTEATNYILNALHQYPPRGTQDSITYLYRLGNAFREEKAFDKSETYFKQLYAISSRLHKDEDYANISLGHVYLDAGEFEKARHYLYKGLSLVKPEENTAGLRYLHYMIYLADSATQHYLTAIEHLNKSNDQAAAEARLEQDKVVRQMEVAYKAREKEQELKLKNQNIIFLQRQAQAQKEKLKQSEKIGLLTAGALVLALAIMVLLFFFYRQKQKSSREMTHKNQQLQKLVSEKEWLLKEVHHRVKNNLHTIFCLLESQARTATPEARNALEKSTHRIYAMSLFHQKVYQSGNIQQVDFGNYMREFLLFLQEGFDLETRNIRVTHEMTSISLPLNLAMPLALIANEALTNAAKYAFEGRSSGEINLSLHPHEQAYKMTISDDGIGITHPGSSDRQSLGMELMHGLCADIGAAINFEVNNGTRINIAFNAG
ncbi:signal transduction histidine kinase [Chitinophaga pinensis DSM 2588]|uniref:histidine kinase n=2 Tax=Chitinophaga pinensis TaxID=79329 RepID=A0A979G2F9_CHIPD|nr:signal transduction histidine kinase [Chitinophaga pinensis DSM 2588]